jgi:hypothetical protein
VSGVTSPKSSFADASQCSQAIQSVFNSNANLIYYPAGISGSQNLQSGFVATPGNATNFLCSTLPLPNSVTFSPGQLTVVSDSGPFATLHDVIAQYQGDNNLVVLQEGSPVWASGHTLPNGGNCGSPSGCQLKFGSDGNFASYFNGVQHQYFRLRKVPGCSQPSPLDPGQGRLWQRYLGYYPKPIASER